MLKLGFVLCPPYPSVLSSVFFFSVAVTSAARPAGEVEAVYLQGTCPLHAINQTGH